MTPIHTNNKNVVINSLPARSIFVKKYNYNKKKLNAKYNEDY